jgi:hypothetical protein
MMTAPAGGDCVSAIGTTAAAIRGRRTNRTCGISFNAVRKVATLCGKLICHGDHRGFRSRRVDCLGRNGPAATTRAAGAPTGGGTSYLGQPLQPAEHKQINDAIGNADEVAAVAALEAILDGHTLVAVDINAESRVKVEQRRATPELVEAGARLFLVKVVNQGGVTAELNVVSPNSGDVYIKSNGSAEPPTRLTRRESTDRWADITLYQRAPMRRRLSGLALEYQILEVYSRDAGQRSAKISFNVGQGSQDIGFRNDVTILFKALPARSIALRIKDEKGQPAMAGLIIRDRLNRFYPLPSK